MKKYFGRKWRRIDDKWLVGVCSGTAYAIGIPTWMVRVAWLILALIYDFGIISYLVLWIAMPKWDKTPDDFKKIAGG